MIKASMPRQGLHVMLFLIILDRFSCLFPRANKRVSHHGLAIYIQKYLKAKQDLWKFKYFTMQNIIYKKSSTRNQNAFRYYNSVTNLKFQHKPKYHLSNHIKIGLLLPRGQNTLSYCTHNESEHNFLAYQGKANKNIAMHLSLFPLYCITPSADFLVHNTL